MGYQNTSNSFKIEGCTKIRGGGDEEVSSELWNFPKFHWTPPLLEEADQRAHSPEWRG